MPLDDGVLQRAWLALVAVARKQRTITYGELNQELGSPVIDRSVGKAILDPLYYDFCVPNNLPDISSLVVLKRSQRPAIGYYKSNPGGVDEAWWRKRLAKTYRWVWPTTLPPRA